MTRKHISFDWAIKRLVNDNNRLKCRLKTRKMKVTAKSPTSSDKNQLQRGQLFMKINDMLIMLKKDGWYLVSTRGSHRQFKHPTKSGRVTVAGKT